MKGRFVRDHSANPQRGHSRLASSPALGMTLLELMVAISIFAVLGSALYPVVGGALASRNDATRRVAVLSEARAILDRIESDLAANCDAGIQGGSAPRLFAPRPSRSSFGRGERNILETTTLVTRGVTPVDGFVAGEDVTALAPDRGDQAHVLWRIDADGRLLRHEIRPVRSDLVDWRDEPFEVVSEHADVVLEFWQPETWLDEWDSRTSGKRRPLAVRTSLRVGDEPATAVTLVSTLVFPEISAATNLDRSRQRGRDRDSGEDGDKKSDDDKSSDTGKKTNGGSEQ
jgi:prepilin-type N-terminal cleavage/methylation domain-containing protein